MKLKRQKTKDAGKNYFLYITNRDIALIRQEKFLTNDFKYKGDIEVDIVDLSKLATSLMQSDLYQKVYNILGINLSVKIEASLQEIAMSTFLLFSDEASELKNDIIESNIKSILLIEGQMSIGELENKAQELLRYDCINVNNICRSIISRLISKQQIKIKNSIASLDDNEYKKMASVRDNFIAMKDVDVLMLSQQLKITPELASELLDLALKIIIRKRDLAGEGPDEDKLRDILSAPEFRNRKLEIYDALSSTNTANIKQNGIYIEQLLTANTFDIYRALGQRTELIMILDSSVAMPVLFGLEFGDSPYRYSIAGKALKEICNAHGIKMMIPKCYLNEMAAHGKLALDRLATYESLPEEAKDILKISSNAYIAHYTHIKNMEDNADTEDLTLINFLRHFGIVDGVSLYAIENRIQSLFEDHDIGIIYTPPFSEDLKREVKKEKSNEQDIIIDHDASVLTLLNDNLKNGYILATWDKVMVKCVQNIARVLADTPTRVINLLSLVKRESLALETNIDILNTLLYVDEEKIAQVAETIDRISTVEQAYHLRQIIDKARNRYGTNWELSSEDVQSVIEGRDMCPTTNSPINNQDDLSI